MRLIEAGQLVGGLRQLVACSYVLTYQLLQLSDIQDDGADEGEGEVLEAVVQPFACAI